MDYRELPPPETLADYLENLWIFEMGDGDVPQDHVIVPDGTVSISAALLPGMAPMLALVGPTTKAYRRPLTRGAVYCGVRVRAGLAGSLLGRDIQVLAGTFSPLNEIDPGLEAAIRAALPAAPSGSEVVDAIIAALVALAAAAAPADAPVRDFARTIMDAHGDLVLREAAAHYPVGERQLRRRFLYQCGITPKEFARLRRVRHACIRLVMERDAAAPASSRAGFADQAHMTREFREVFGASTGMVTAYLNEIRHFVMPEGERHNP